MRERQRVRWRQQAPEEQRHGLEQVRLADVVRAVDEVDGAQSVERDRLPQVLVPRDGEATEAHGGERTPATAEIHRPTRASSGPETGSPPLSPSLHPRNPT